MSPINKDKPVLAETVFEGEVAINGKTAPITSRVWAGADCRLRITAGPVSGQLYLLVLAGEDSHANSVTKLNLTGKSADGKTIASEQVFVRAHGSHNDGPWLEFGSRACSISVPLDKPIDRPVLRLWFRSFMTYHNLVIETSLGRLSVQGEAQSVAPDDMSGCVTLEAPSNDPGNDWREEADKFLTHMHRGLALAHGGRLQTPRLDFVHGLVWEATFFDGAGFPSELPVQHHLNQSPYIAALAERYKLKGSLPEILWTALGWMQTDTSFDETRFLSGMTALEAIIEAELPQKRGTMIPTVEFKPLRQKIEAVIEADDTLPEEVRKIYLGKVKQLNKKAFSQKIHALFDHYAIPKLDFEGDAIGNLVKLRNDIVHTGVIPSSADIWASIILVRELVTRILLKEIGFVGRYCCYVGKRHDRDFPGPI